MYKPITGGTKELIYNLYECWVPPVGKGLNSVTGELEDTDILKRSGRAQDQFWERTPLPQDWNKNRAKEKMQEKADADYFDPKLENFRVQEWKRRLCGVWVYINGVPTYLTGEHYMYLNWWCLDDGYPQYRDPDRRRYYALLYCIEDPRCAGMIEAANRRSGKSYRGSLFVYEYISRTADAYGGIQSKTDADAKSLFKGKLITPFKRLPDFFRPEIDTMAGSNPERELKMMKTTKRGKYAMDDFSAMGLNSLIGFKSSEMYAMDGLKALRYLGDEVGKTEKVDVYDRHEVVKYCLRVGGKWVGKCLLTTTVERLKGESAQTEAFQKLWMASNPKERDANGHTKSGMYKYFTPAYEMYEFDKYGMPKIEEGKTFYMNTREGLRDDSHRLNAEICKNPFSEQELFRGSGDTCIYDAVILNDRRDQLTWMENVTEQGNFEWKNGEKDTEVEWRKNSNGRWLMCTGFKFDDPADRNNIIRQGNQFKAGNKTKYVAGIDGYDHDVTEDNSRQSNAASHVKKKHQIGKEDDPYNEAFVVEYCARPPMSSIFYEDMIKQCVYFGCDVLCENNKPGVLKYFKERGYEWLLIMLPGYKEPGVPATQENKKVLAEVTEEYIYKTINKVYFPKLIDDWLSFNPMKTQKYDRAMSAGWCLVADAYRTVKKTTGKLTDITNYFRMNKIING